MTTKRIIFGIWFAIVLIAEILIGIFARGFMRAHIGDVLAVMGVYFLGRIFLPQKPQFLSAFAFGIALLVELLQLTPLHGILAQKSEILAVIVGSTFDYRDIICYFIGGIICAAVDFFVIGKSKKISG